GPGRDRADAPEHVPREPPGDPGPNPRLLDRGHGEPVLRPLGGLPRGSSDAGRARRRGGGSGTGAVGAIPGGAPEATSRGPDIAASHRTTSPRSNFGGSGTATTETHPPTP